MERTTKKEKEASTGLDFESSLARAMALSGSAIILPGLVLSAIFGGWKGILGAFAGFLVASAHSVAVILILRWAFSKPAQVLPTILMASYFCRLVVLAGVLYGLTFLKFLNIIAMLTCFLVLYVAHTLSEIVLAYRSFGALTKGGE